MLEKLDDRNVFRYFEEISMVPRGSFHNEKISAYLVDFARKHKLKYQVDEALNVIIWKPASSGCSSTYPIMMQGHMDMVCVAEREHNFEQEPLCLIVEGDFVKADGTTLGGDDGIAVAYMLALLDSDDICHPPLEMVFTTDEEVGMEGAMALDVSELKSKQLINLDNEEQGVFIVSCAGGATSTTTFSGERVWRAGNVIELQITGLCGGHSGTEIHKHPTNASVLLGNIIHEAIDGEYGIVTMEGGEKDNVITKEARCVLIMSDSTQVEEKVQLVWEEKKKQMPEEKEAELIVAMQPAQKVECLDDKTSRAIIEFMGTTITGVQSFSDVIPNMVESSLNMGTLIWKEDSVSLGFSVRSQKEESLDEMLKKLSLQGQQMQKKYGCQVKENVRGRYPGWDVNPESKLRDIMKKKYEERFGKEPVVEGIHAGLECGIFAHKIQGLDIVSIGPDIHDIHTTKEKLSISSTKDTYELLVDVVEYLAKNKEV